MSEITVHGRVLTCPQARLGRLLLAWGLLLAAPPPSAVAVAFTWTQTSAGSHAWSDTANWASALTPSLPGTNTDVIWFLDNANSFANAFALTASNNVGPLVLNRLVPRGTGPASGSATITLTGGVLTFDGANPQIDYDHRTATLRYIIANDLVLNGTLQVATTGNGTAVGPLSLTGQISGSGGLGAVHRIQPNNNADVTVTGLNTYTGATYVHSGVLRFNSIADVGGGASALGAPTTATTGRIEIGNGGLNATLFYSGTLAAGHSTDRLVRFVGTSGSVGLTASGAGPIRYTTGVDNAGSADRAFTLSGSNTGENILGNMTGNRVNLTKSGAGLWIVGANGANSIYNVTVNGGVLRLAPGVSLGTGNLSFSEHHDTHSYPTLLELSTDFARPLGTGAGQVQFGTASRNSPAGFSAYGNDIRVALGTLTTPEALTWGVLPFKPGIVYLNSVYADGTLDFLNPINLNGAARTVNVGASTAILSGTLTGAGSSGLTKQGAGTLMVSGDNSYNGNTTVGTGTLVAGHANAFGSTGTITINSGAAFGPAAGVTFSRFVTFNAGSRLVGNGTLVRGAAWTVPAAFTLSPGLSLGTLAVDVGAANTLTLAGDTTLALEITGAGQADQLAVIGSLNLGGADLLVSGLTVGDGYWYTVATAASITGSLGTIDVSGVTNASGSPLYDWRIAGGNTLQLQVIPEPGALALLALAGAAGLLRRRC